MQICKRGGLMSKKSDQVRAKILKEFYRLIRNKGYDETSLRELGEICDMSKGHINFYFKRKEDIMIAVIEKLYAISYTAINEYEEIPDDPLLRIFLRHLFLQYLSSERQGTYSLVASMSKNNVFLNWYALNASDQDYDAFTKSEIPINKQALDDALVFSMYGLFGFISKNYGEQVKLDYEKAFTLFMKSFLNQIDSPQLIPYIDKTLSVFNALDKSHLVAEFEIELDG